MSNSAGLVVVAAAPISRDADSEFLIAAIYVVAGGPHFLGAFGFPDGLTPTVLRTRSDRDAGGDGRWRRLLEGFFDQAKTDEATAEMGDMLVTVAAAPAGFPHIESGVVREYEYGMNLEEVTLGFDADIEIGLPAWAAKALLDSGTATVVGQDSDWAVMAVPGVEMECTAQLRVEFEDAEITELWIGLREG